MRPVVVLGAGPTGIGAGLRLMAGGCRDFTILEAAAEVGGLSRSFTDGAGFTWDLGGHVFFSRNEPFSRALAGLPLADHARRSFVRIAGRQVPYPVQANVGRLPAGMALRSARHLLGPRPTSGDDPPFDAWCRRTFGDALTESFFLPYNRKAWGVDPALLDDRWIAPAVQIPRRGEILRSLLGLGGGRWGMNASFSYPRDGGCGSIWTRLAAPLEGRVRLGAAAVAVDTERKVVVLDGGPELPYGTVVSSIPLPDLVAILRPRRPALEALAGTLLANRVLVTGLGVAGTPPERPWSWVYLPDPSVPFYRISLLSSYSPALVPAPGRTWSLLAETTLAGGDAPDGGEIEAAARALGFLPPGGSLLSTFTREIPVAYPVPLRGRFATLRLLQAELGRLGILSRGRFGAWLYEASSMDTSFLMGWEAAGAALAGEPERLLPRTVGGLPGAPGPGTLGDGGGGAAPDRPGKGGEAR